MSNHDNTSTNDTSARIFASLHAEMELTTHSKLNGQNVKRHPRHLRPALTKKRKSLEYTDRCERAIEVVEDDGRRRMRGQKVAFEDVVINDMPMMDRSRNHHGDDSDDEVDADHIMDDVNKLGIDIDGDSDDEEDSDEVGDEQEANVPPLPSMTTQKSKHKNKSRTIRNKKRTIYRLRDFSSHRLALKHGEALGAHVRGDSETAVQKLRDVAKAAPGAPQVYSSLGMVYECMLEELETKMNDESFTVTSFVRSRRGELAQKAYASLHIASVLCKKDFVLWERSGDMAMRLVHMYSDTTHNSSSSSSSDAEQDSQHRETMRKEQKQWYEHALSAYTSADNLRPPGVDVPCKLARTHMEMGNFIDALSILSGLKNRGVQSSTSFSGMDGSYPCWLLYADLMMKIGFECKQWNEGTSTDQSYMTKRWLRKYSNTFDWKERRLQALCLALEAAAGSKSCDELSKRMRERTKQLFVSEIEKDTSQDMNANSEAAAPSDPDEKQATLSDEIGQQHATTVTVSSEPATTNDTYENERSNIVKKNEIELQKFDSKSNSMNLIPGSHVHRNRMAARLLLIDKHRESIRELAKKKYYDVLPDSSKISHDSNNRLQAAPNDDAGTSHLPLQASCTTVCQIAALLLMQCIQSKLYEDGLVVARSVLSYYKERVVRHKRRLEKRKRFEMRTDSAQAFVHEGILCDGSNFESDDSDEDEHELFISDDEDLEQSDYIDALQKGILPVNLRAFYSLCLVGAGGQDYLAMKYLEKVMLSDEFGLLEKASDGEKLSTEWALFQTQFNLPLNKTSMLALVIDIMKDKTAVQRRLKFQTMLESHLDTLDTKHGLDQLMSSNDELLRENTIKILFAMTKMMLANAELELESLLESNKGDPDVLRKVAGDGLSALNNVIRFQHILWRPNKGEDWSLPTVSLETLEILSSAMSLLSHVLSTNQAGSVEDMIEATLLKSQSIMTLICGSGHNDNSSLEPNVSASWKSFPLPCEWQSPFHKNISILAYNLCVGCCVSSFSGWTAEEFNLDQLHTRDDSNIFGVNMEGSYVAGFLSNDATVALSRQWENIHDILPNLEPLRFDALLNQREDKEWYKKIVGIANRQSSKIASFKEDDGLMMLLSFATICLVGAEHSDERDHFIKQAMSILLPVTRFSIDKDLWNSRIGARAINEVNETSIGYYVDEKSQWLGPTIDSRKSNVYKTISKKSQDQFSRKTFTNTRPEPRRNRRCHGIQVPTSIMLNEWKSQKLPISTGDVSEDAKDAMKAVDDAMTNLRKSRTINALERSSLDVSVALINVASHEECHDPFLVLQQAAIYAAMGTKLGNSDEPFKSFLPLQKRCTALNALVILGRADCLRAIYFVESAQFLCSWVATVCVMHRSNNDDELPWNSRWKIVGAYLAFVSANVDGTAAELDDSDLPDWDDHVKQEIKNGKTDAKSMLSDHPGDDEANGRLGKADNIPHLRETVANDPHGYEDFNPIDGGDIGTKLQDVRDEDLLFSGVNWASV